MPTTYWSPNQAAVAQVETYTFSAPNSVGNHYKATINGKTVTYTSVSGDTAATAATGLFELLNVSTGIAAEFTEIQFANPSDGVITATAKTPGTPFANITINGGTGQGLVLSTGNGLANGISTAHTTPNYSPSDVSDVQNWLRFTGTHPTMSPGVRAIPVNGDDVEVSNSSIPMLWNLDHLAAVQFNTYTRWQTMEGEIGLPDNNPNGYKEWRATYFRFVGPQGSVPSGGLIMLLGQGSAGNGPSRERYNVGSQKVSIVLRAHGQPADDFGVMFLGVHTDNTFKVLGGTSLGIAMREGEIASLSTSTLDGNSLLGIGAGVVWTANSTLSLYGGAAIISSAPATLALYNGAQVTIDEDGLTWATITAQGGSNINMLAGGIITSYTATTGSILNKSEDLRALTITNSTIDGDTCQIIDPLNTITYTNATSVKQQVTSGPFIFTGTRTVKVT